MHALTLISIMTCLSLLSGCSEIETINTDTDRETCSGYGFSEGTDAFATCMMRLDRDRARSLSQNDPPRGNGGRPIDSRPQFDKNGNPNFNTQGDYIGCHGLGCLVDNPDA